MNANSVEPYISHRIRAWIRNAERNIQYHSNRYASGTTTREQFLMKHAVYQAQIDAYNDVLRLIE